MVEKKKNAIAQPAFVEWLNSPAVGLCATVPMNRDNPVN